MGEVGRLHQPNHSILFPSVDTFSFRFHTNHGSAYATYHLPSHTYATGEIKASTFHLTRGKEEDWPEALPEFLPEGYLETFPCSQVDPLPFKLNSVATRGSSAQIDAGIPPGWTLRELIREVSVNLKIRATWAKTHGLYLCVDEDG